MRRTSVVFMLVLLTSVFLGGGVALAAAISGTQGNDTLTGTVNVDQIYGLNGDDDIFGRAGSDQLYGGANEDELSGGRGGDELYGGSGIDILEGGAGSDYINSADKNRQDIVNCGNGAADRAIVDNEDTVAGNCENVQVVL